jgi:hypothetical protein
MGREDQESHALADVWQQNETGEDRPKDATKDVDRIGSSGALSVSA